MRDAARIDRMVTILQNIIDRRSPTITEGSQSITYRDINGSINIPISFRQVLNDRIVGQR